MFGVLSGMPLALAITLALLKASVKAPGRYVESIGVDGQERTFVVRIPKAASSGKPLPLVVVLHGWTATGAAAELYTRMGAKSDQAGFVAVFPDGTGPKGRLGWNAGFLDLSGQGHDDAEFVSRLIDHVEAETPIDRRRVFVCGHSNGAFLSHLVAAKLGSKVRAIGAVAGTIGLDGVKPPRIIPKPASPVSVLIIHGMKDPLVAYDHASRAILQSVPALECAAWWAKQDGARGPRAVRNDATMDVREWWGGKSGTIVRLVSLKHGVHDWPGGRGIRGSETASGADAADMIWDFFQRVGR